MRPHPGAIFADAPALLLVSSLASSGLKGQGGNACFLVFWKVEGREVPTQNLGGGVALEALRSSIPTRYVAMHVEPVDGVVGDTFDQKPKALAIIYLLRASPSNVHCEVPNRPWPALLFLLLATGQPQITELERDSSRRDGGNLDIKV